MAALFFINGGVFLPAIIDFSEQLYLIVASTLESKTAEKKFVFIHCGILLHRGSSRKERH